MTDLGGLERLVEVMHKADQAQIAGEATTRIADAPFLIGDRRDQHVVAGYSSSRHNVPNQRVADHSHFAHAARADGKSAKNDISYGRAIAVT